MVVDERWRQGVQLAYNVGDGEERKVSVNGVLRYEFAIVSKADLGRFVRGVQGILTVVRANSGEGRRGKGERGKQKGMNAHVKRSEQNFGFLTRSIVYFLQ